MLTHNTYLENGIQKRTYCLVKFILAECTYFVNTFFYFILISANTKKIALTHNTYLENGIYFRFTVALII